MGGDGYEGQCMMSCGKCYPGEDGAPLDASGPAQSPPSHFDTRMSHAAVSLQNGDLRPLRWPAKQVRPHIHPPYPVFHVISHSLFGPMSYRTVVK